MNDPKDSQQEPEQDSALQTPQPDQPHPPVSDRDEGQDSTEVHVETDGPAEVNVDVPAAPAE